MELSGTENPTPFWYANQSLLFFHVKRPAFRNFLAEKLAFLETEPEEWNMAVRPSFVWDRKDETRLNH